MADLPSSVGRYETVAVKRKSDGASMWKHTYAGGLPSILCGAQRPLLRLCFHLRTSTGQPLCAHCLARSAEAVIMSVLDTNSLWVAATSEEGHNDLFSEAVLVVQIKFLSHLQSKIAYSKCCLLYIDGSRDCAVKLGLTATSGRGWAC